MAKKIEIKPEQSVMSIIKHYKAKGVSKSDIVKLMKPKRGQEEIVEAEVTTLLNEMALKGTILKRKKTYILSKALGIIPAVVVRVNSGFGFARPEGWEQDVFIPGKAMMGTLPGDMVLMKISGRDGRFDGSVEHIVQEVTYTFTGTYHDDKNGRYIMPDKDMRLSIVVSGKVTDKVRDGDKVQALMIRGGESHFDHRGEILQVFGDGAIGKNCSDAVLLQQGVRIYFPEEVIEQANTLDKNGIHPKEILQREDLREAMIFTIDGADTKDIDDAVSISKTSEGYQVGVHIADVSYYVTSDTVLDNEAKARGTSIYFADRVIPMLPPALSNGICSLNPSEERLAFSAQLFLDAKGELVRSKFVKTIIRSKVKGVYSEINEILSKTASVEIMDKYKDVLPSIFIMDELCDLLLKTRESRGGLELESTESKIVLDESGVAVDVKARTRGKSERIIEELMLKANEAAARLAIQAELPFYYRIHPRPTSEKLEELCETLGRLGLDTRGVETGDPVALLRVLKSVEGGPISRVVNTLILRTMAKARYSEVNVGHYGLVLENYAHFTSPIRRYPDLAIHRILSFYTANMKSERLIRRFAPSITSDTIHASQMEVLAVSVERSCTAIYKAEYMKQHIGEEFDGIISGVISSGFFVELESTVEGFVPTATLPIGTYDCDGHVSLTEMGSGVRYRVGEPIRIRVVGVDVSGGKVDFAVL